MEANVHHGLWGKEKRSMEGVKNSALDEIIATRY